MGIDYEPFKKMIVSLSKFKRPLDFLSIINSDPISSFPNGRFFNDPTNKLFQSFREAWVIGKLASGLQQFSNRLKVKLNTQDPPDTYIQMEGIEYGFEITTAYKPERKIGQEYKELEKNPLQGKPYEPGRGSQEGSSWITNAIKNKHNKHYTHQYHLLVYANFEINSLDPSAISKSCYPWANAFMSIWVLNRSGNAFSKICGTDIFMMVDCCYWYRV